jgi:hypothetical protein
MSIPHKIMANMIRIHYNRAGILLTSGEIENYQPPHTIRSLAIITSALPMAAVMAVFAIATLIAFVVLCRPARQAA